METITFVRFYTVAVALTEDQVDNVGRKPLFANGQEKYGNPIYLCVIQAEKVQRKQTKREKSEKQQVELQRLQELLRLQTLLDSLGDDSIRQSLQSGNADLVGTDVQCWHHCDGTVLQLEA